MWLTFISFHLILVVIGLLVLWWLQVQPESIQQWFLSVVESRPVAVLGFVGVSVATVLVLYVKAWRKLYAKLTTPYIFRGLAD